MANNSKDTCGCMPFNDSILITAQILAIVAMFLSWTTFWTIVLGGIAFVMLQVIWCCRMNKCGLITSGVLAVIAGCCAIVAGILVLTAGASAICEEAQTNNPDVTIDADQCRFGVHGYAAVAFVGGVVWLVCSTLVFVFTCGDRYKNLENSTGEAAYKTHDAVVVNEGPEKTATPNEAEDKA